MKHYLGIDIGGTKCAVVRGNQNGDILSKRRFPTTDCKTTLDTILAAARDLIDESRAASPPRTVKPRWTPSSPPPAT